MAVVVSDTSPVRALAHLGLLQVLHDLYGDVLVPPKVAQELLHPPGKLIAVDVGLLPFVQMQAPRDQMQVLSLMRSLDAGEAEAVALALEVRPAALLIDEAAGRATATGLGLTVIGTLGTLVRAKAQGLIQEVKSPMDRLEAETGFFVSPAVRARVLHLAGE